MGSTDFLVGLALFVLTIGFLFTPSMLGEKAGEVVRSYRAVLAEDAP